jgi:putative transposase
MGIRNRNYDEEAAYFVTSVTKGRVPLLVDDAAGFLVDVLEDCRRRYRFLLLAFIVMPDHLHAIIVPGPGNTISTVMRYVKGTYARRLNSLRG